MEAYALTDSEFWDDLWKNIRLPALVQPEIQWQFALAKALLRHLPRGRSLKLFEIGCAPGRWLVWFSQALEYQVAGCDSSARGVQLTRDNLRLNHVDAEIYQADVLSDDLPAYAFDVVVSLGVIEHFQAHHAIIERHLALLKPGGYLVLEVPNMAGWLNYHLLCMAGMQNLLSVHNLTVMNRAFFQAIAQDWGLQITFLGYVGGFDPGLVVYNYAYPPHTSQMKALFELWRRKHWIVPALWALERIFRIYPACFAHLNAPCCSSMLLGIFRVPENA